MISGDLFSDVLILGGLMLAVVVDRSEDLSESKDHVQPRSEHSVRYDEDTDAQIQSLRFEHAVVLVDAGAAGTGVAYLPEGVYGYSHSPQSGSPLFQRKIFQSFEVHKVPGEGVHIIGFVTGGEASRLKAGSADKIKLYPDPAGEATHVVSVPLSKSVLVKGPDREDGYSLEISVG